MNESSPKLAPLDLSKLAPLELPVEPLAIRLKGDVTVDEKTGEKKQNVQTIPIHPISGSGLIAWGNNPKNAPSGVTFEERACLTALIYVGLPASPCIETRIYQTSDRFPCGWAPRKPMD